MTEGKKDTYQSLIEKIGDNTVDEFMRFLQEQCELFLREASYKGSVVCNDRILFHAILDYYSDIERLKQFHHIEDVRTNKVFAYIAYWILRRKPLQFINDDIEEPDIFVNERFALFLVINECLLEGVNYALGAEGQKKFDEYLDFLLYYFKYRECSPQALELLIETFKMGIEFQKTEQ
ncbi:MAG: hypothetical protein NC541_07910 [bacterium]|nr:hypothetical protein [bacterium]